MKVSTYVVWAVLASVQFSAQANGQSTRTAEAPRKAPCVVEDIDTPTMPACVVQSRNGALFIPKKYWMHPAFNRYGLSAFASIPSAPFTSTALVASLSATLRL